MVQRRPSKAIGAGIRVSRRHYLGAEGWSGEKASRQSLAGQDGLGLCSREWKLLCGIRENIASQDIKDGTIV